MATIMTGLGVLQSHLGFVETSGSFWDSTQWTYFPRKFLDDKSLGYVNACAAWFRNDPSPEWATDLPPHTRKAIHKALKYLNKTSDSFFHPESVHGDLLSQSQSQWIELANSKSVAKQIIAIRHLNHTASDGGNVESVLIDKLRSRVDQVVMHAIFSVEKLKLNSAPIVEELRLLVESTNDMVKSKSLCTLTLFQKIDDNTIDRATKMLASRVNYVEFAAIFALSSLDQVPEYVLQPASRGLIRSLQSCNYELIGHFVNGFNRWMDEPELYFKDLLENDGPEYLEITLEALDNVRNQLVSLG